MESLHQDLYLSNTNELISLVDSFNATSSSLKGEAINEIPSYVEVIEDTLSRIDCLNSEVKETFSNEIAIIKETFLSLRDFISSNILPIAHMDRNPGNIATDKNGIYKLIDIDSMLRDVPIEIDLGELVAKITLSSNRRETAMCDSKHSIEEVVFYMDKNGYDKSIIPLAVKFKPFIRLISYLENYDCNMSPMDSNVSKLYDSVCFTSQLLEQILPLEDKPTILLTSISILSSGDLRSIGKVAVELKNRGYNAVIATTKQGKELAELFLKDEGITVYQLPSLVSRKLLKNETQNPLDAHGFLEFTDNDIPYEEDYAFQKSRTDKMKAIIKKTLSCCFNNRALAIR